MFSSSIASARESADKCGDGIKIIEGGCRILNSEHQHVSLLVSKIIDFADSSGSIHFGGSLKLRYLLVLRHYIVTAIYRPPNALTTFMCRILWSSVMKLIERMAFVQSLDRKTFFGHTELVLQAKQTVKEGFTSSSRTCGPAKVTCMLERATPMDSWVYISTNSTNRLPLVTRQLLWFCKLC